jgi:hypothetical protein
MEKGELGRLATAIRAFDYEKFTGKPVIAVCDHRRMSLWASCYSDVNASWTEQGDENFVPLTTRQIKLG